MIIISKRKFYKFLMLGTVNTHYANEGANYGVCIPIISVVVHQRITWPEGILKSSSSSTNKLQVTPMNYVTLLRYHGEVILYKMYGAIYFQDFWPLKPRLDMGDSTAYFVEFVAYYKYASGVNFAPCSYLEIARWECWSQANSQQNSWSHIFRYYT